MAKTRKASRAGAVPALFMAGIGGEVDAVGYWLLLQTVAHPLRRLCPARV